MINLLAVTYAFPPLRIPMAPVCFKQMAAFLKIGCSVSIITISLDKASLSHFNLSQDDSLNKLVDSYSWNIIRVNSFRKKSRIFNNKFKILQHLVDPMADFQKNMFDHLMGINLSNYDAIISFSPFHSINIVLSQIKRHRDFHWVAHFCDPWHQNPLEKRFILKIGNYFYERSSLPYCDLLAHSTQGSLDLMKKNNRFLKKIPGKVISHGYLRDLYPNRKKNKNNKIMIRHIGTLFESRTPKLFFEALQKLINRWPSIIDLISVELIGNIESKFIETELFLSFPSNLVIIKPMVNYLDSLELMYDANILLLIESISHNGLFSPSKLADYLGSQTSIFGIMPEGYSAQILRSYGHSVASSPDPQAISLVLENLIRETLEKTSYAHPTDETLFDSTHIADDYLKFILRES